MGAGSLLRWQARSSFLISSLGFPRDGRNQNQAWVWLVPALCLGGTPMYMTDGGMIFLEVCTGFPPAPHILWVVR